MLSLAVLTIESTIKSVAWWSVSLIDFLFNISAMITLEKISPVPWYDGSTFSFRTVVLVIPSNAIAPIESPSVTPVNITCLAPSSYNFWRRRLKYSSSLSFSYLYSIPVKKQASVIFGKM